jgi:hypothetical protein
MSSGPRSPLEEALIKRIRSLFQKLDDVPPRSPEYERLSAEIDELGKVFQAGKRDKDGLDPES